MQDEVRLWRCENGHILGEIRRNGSRRKNLWLYRYAVNDGKEDVEESAMIKDIGYAEVHCSICGAVRRWYPEFEEMV